MQTFYPFLCKQTHHAVKITCIRLKTQIPFCTCLTCKRSSSFKDDRLMGLTINCKPSAKTITSKICDFIGTLQHEMSAEACTLSPSLIDTMNWIIAIYHLLLCIYRYTSLTFITIMVDYNMNRAILFWCYTEDSSMT